MGDKNVVKCRTCNGDHWTSKCPWKDTILVGGKAPDEKKLSAVTNPGGKLYLIFYYWQQLDVFIQLIIKISNV